MGSKAPQPLPANTSGEKPFADLTLAQKLAAMALGFSHGIRGTKPLSVVFQEVIDEELSSLRAENERLIRCAKETSLNIEILASDRDSYFDEAKDLRAENERQAAEIQRLRGEAKANLHDKGDG